MGQITRAQPSGPPPAASSVGTAPARERATTIQHALLLFLATAGVYLLSYNGQDRPYDHFVLLADAFLQGRLDLADPPSGLAEIAPWQGRFYVVYPPMPAVLLVPFVALFGPVFLQIALSVLLGGANAALCYLVVLRLVRERTVALWVAALYAFGTIQWFHSASGAPWPLAQVVAPFFLWLALLEAFTRGRPLVIGLAISGAFLSRLPTLGAAAFFAIMYWDRLSPFGRVQRHVRAGNVWRGVQFGAGLLAGLALAALYNQVRFGSPTQFGYSLVPGLMAEPIYRYGWISLRYIPLRLEDMFLAMPRFQGEWPYVIPRAYVMAFWLTTPAFAIVAWARWRSRLALAAAAAILCTCVPILLHGGPGYFQFGFRYSLDFMPFLMLLVASGMRGRVTWWHQALILVSIAINLWGVIMINRFNLWTW